MLTATILYPMDFFSPLEKKRFKTNVKTIVATYMNAHNPITGEMTDYGADPDKFINLVLMPYAPYDAEVTAAFLATIVTYDWPDRMSNIDKRIEAITDRVRSLIPANRVTAGQKTISFAFIAVAALHSA